MANGRRTPSTMTTFLDGSLFLLLLVVVVEKDFGSRATSSVVDDLVRIWCDFDNIIFILECAEECVLSITIFIKRFSLKGLKI